MPAIQSNKKAVAEHGWGPLDYYCLMNKKINGIAKLKASTVPEVSAPPPEDLNLSNKIAGSLIEQIVDYTNRERAKAGENMTEQFRLYGETAMEKMKTSKQ